jgi:arylsulfatase K
MKTKSANIIYIQTDSMDGRVMGCMGHPAAYTPNLDALAARGSLFRNAYCNSPICVPSRSSMWSGQYPHVVESWNNDTGLPEDTMTFESVLKRNGYRTEIIGRADHYSGKHSLSNRVADWTRTAKLDIRRKDAVLKVKFIDEPLIRVREKDWNSVDVALSCIDDCASDPETPFFIHLGLLHPHTGAGFNTSRYYLDRIDPQQVGLPAQDSEIHPVCEYMRVAKNLPENMSPDEILQIRRHYYAMVAEVDEMVGTVMKKLEEAGLSESTYIMFNSDHGEMNLEHGQWKKMAMYEASVRVPMMITGPGVRPGSTCGEPVSLLDVFPTLMDMAEIEQPAGLQGSSLLPYCLHGSFDHPDWVMVQYNCCLQPTGSYMLRMGDWKYIAYPGYPPQLFHVLDDPDELHNRCDSEPETTDAMDRKLRSLIDYEEVNAYVKKYDLSSFRQWRDSLSDQAYHDAMKQIFGEWTSNEEQSIRKWLDQ